MRNILLVILLFCSIDLNASTNITSWNPPAGGSKKTYSDSYSFSANSGDILTCKCNGTISSGSQVSINLTVNGEKKTIYTHSNPNIPFDNVVTYQFQDGGVFTLSYNYTHNGGGTAYKISINASLNDFVKITSLQLDATSLLLDVGNKSTLIPIIAPEYASNKAVDWASSDESVATISSEGVITALKAGATTITASSTDGTNYQTTCKVAVRNLSEHHDYVDLGLPSGTLWATSNIGAFAPEEQGYNYAWGELYPSENFWTTDSPKYTVTKYNSSDKLTELAPEDDVATIMWGNDWKIPTKEDFQELIDNCKFSYDYSSAGTAAELGSKDYVTCKFTAKNGNYILLPQSSILASHSGTEISYWASTIEPQESAVISAYQGAYSYQAQTTTNYNKLRVSNRWRSMPIRPISKCIMVKELSILPTLDLNVGENCQLEANITPDNATNPSIVWSSNNESVAIVGLDGKITAIMSGIAEIKAMTTDGSDLSAICRVSVHNPVTSINLDKKRVTMHVTESLTLKAVCTPIDADDTSISWSSSNNSIVTVDDGTITAIGVGSAIVTASSVNGLSAICNVTVETTYGNSLTINKTSLSLISGEQERLTATLLPSYTTNKEITWKSSAENIVTVSNSGLVIAVSTGTAIITASTTDGTNLSATCVVNVTNPVKSVTLNKNLVELEVEESETIIASCTPSDADDISISWHSKDTNIATVTNGKIEATCVGETEVVAKSVNGVEATCKVIVNPTIATSLKLNKNSLSLTTGNSEKLEATILPVKTTNKTIKWESSNSNIVSVDNSGIVRALSNGTARITASTIDGSNLSDVCTVTVTTLATSISLNQDIANLIVGQSLSLIATIIPSSASNNITWESNNSNCASVSSDGTVHANATGTAIITASTTDGTNLSASCVIVVTNPVNSVTLDKTSAELMVGQQIQIKASCTPSNADNTSITWSSSDNTVATVVNGIVTAKKLGNATITASSVNGIEAKCSINVVPTPISSLILSESTISIVKNQTFALSCTIYPDDATNKELVWYSNNESIAKVNENGIVTGISSGETTVCVKAKSNSNVNASCKVIVTTPATSIKLDPERIELFVEDNVQLKTICSPVDADRNNLKWTSSNTNIADVSDEGFVRTKNEGNVRISVTTTDGTNLSASCDIVVSKIKQTIIWNNELPLLREGGEMTELVASSSSGLPVRFISSDDNVVSIFDLGDVIYANPVNTGKTYISAYHEGNYKYEPVESRKEIEVLENPGSASKTLIAYYSQSVVIDGIVAELANQIASSNASVFTQKIEPTNDRINSANTNSEVRDSVMNVISLYPNDINSYPTIKAVNVNISDYDNVIMVYPLWNSLMAAPMQTFDFNNKDILKNKSIAYVEYDLYGEADPSANAKVLRFNSSNIDDICDVIEDWLGNSEATGILHLYGEKLIPIVGIYDLQGRKLTKAPNHGIFIENKTKIIRK